MSKVSMACGMERGGPAYGKNALKEKKKTWVKRETLGSLAAAAAATATTVASKKCLHSLLLPAFGLKNWMMLMTIISQGPHGKPASGTLDWGT